MYESEKPFQKKRERNKRRKKRNRVEKISKKKVEYNDD